MVSRQMQSACRTVAHGSRTAWHGCRHITRNRCTAGVGVRKRICRFPLGKSGSRDTGGWHRAESTIRGTASGTTYNSRCRWHCAGGAFFRAVPHRQAPVGRRLHAGKTKAVMDRPSRPVEPDDTDSSTACGKTAGGKTACPARVQLDSVFAPAAASRAASACRSGQTAGSTG